MLMLHNNYCINKEARRLYCTFLHERLDLISVLYNWMYCCLIIKSKLSKSHLKWQDALFVTCSHKDGLQELYIIRQALVFSVNTCVFIVYICCIVPHVPSYISGTSK